MFNGLPAKHLPFWSSFGRLKAQHLFYRGVKNTASVAKISTQIALILVITTFLSGYQPIFSIPPIQKKVVHAQSEQSTSIDARSLPLSFQLPHPGYLSTRFSAFHPGVDIASGLGMPIHPVAKGKVSNQGFNFWGLGLVVTIDHGYGYTSTYAHMGKIYVKTGQEVDITDTLGEVGLTGKTSGPHTHLEITKDQKSIDPLTLLPTIRDFPKAEDFIAVGGHANFNPIAPPATPSAKISQNPTTPQPALLPR